MKSRLRAWTVAVVAFGVTATVGLLGAATPATAATVVAAPSDASIDIDLSNPTAGITDPLSGITPLDRNCTAGQVDINTAPQAIIAAALGVKSTPTAARIVSTRPFLRAIDVVSVPGVGPEKKALLASKFCATPTVLPPATGGAPKAGFTGLDLQVATGSQIAALGILDGPTSQRLADYGPLPADLHTVATPAVPGLSDPLITQLMASGKVAITPQPFTYAGKSWKWASHDHGAVIEAANDSRYALIVPAGRVTGDGAWATTVVLPDEYDALPSADFHVYGQWTPWLGTRLPTVLEGAPASDLYVWHDAWDGPRLSAAPNLWTDGTTVVASVASLSQETVSLLPIQSPCHSAPGSIYCANDKGQAFIGQLQDSSLQTLLERLQRYQNLYQPVAPGPCPSGSTPRIVTRGESWTTCSLSERGSSVTATLTNTPPVDFLAFGNTLSATQNPGTFATQHANPLDRGVVTAMVFDALTDHNPGTLPPGYAGTLSFSEGDPQVSLTTQSASATLSLFGWGLYQVTSLGDSLFVGDPRTIDARKCVPSSLSVPSARDMVGCVRGMIESGTKVKMAAWPKSSAEFKRAASVLRTVAKGLTVLDAVLSAAQWTAQQTPRTATFQYLAPPPVTSGGTGSLSLSGDGKYIAMDGHRAFLIVPPHPPLLPTVETVAQEIATSDGFNCYAEGYLVIDQVKTYVGTDGRERLTLASDPVVTKGENAPACVRGGPHWDYKSATEGGNTPTGVIVKQPDWIGPRTWWAAADGTLQPITSGGTYLCLAEKAPVLWNFNESFANAWKNPVTDPSNPPPDGPSATAATCP